MKKPTPIHEWPSANQGFFRKFVAWLEQGGMALRPASSTPAPRALPWAGSTKPTG